MNPARLLEYEGDPPEGSAMDKLAQLPEQLATLKVDVEYIKKDVSEIKVDVRRLEDRVHELDKRLGDKFDALQKEFSSAKVWVLSLYIGLAAGLLLVMAKGFKWL